MLENGRKIQFDVDAYTARLIGRENVSKLEGAILELVKNAYDADATAVYIYYSESDDMLLIMDNGEGMTEDVLRTHWMTIGNSSKRDQILSKGKRLKTGAKGIGRFALDRISDDCEMWTATDTSRLVWGVNWNDFSNDRRISEVTATLYDTDESLLAFSRAYCWANQQLADQIYAEDSGFHGTGTVFRLFTLRDKWTGAVQRRIRNNLANLLPPDAVDDFKIYFFNDKTTYTDAEVRSNSIDQFDYRIAFHVSAGKTDTESTLEISLLRNEFDIVGKADLTELGFSEDDLAYFSGTEKKLVLPFGAEVSQPEGRNLIGAFEGTLYFSKASVSEKDRAKFFYKDITGRKNFIKEFGGIKIYRDHFRVRPYGEYGDNDFDWLELSARHNRQPAGVSHPSGRWRVGSDQIMGIVNISRLNAGLEDDANRNGLQAGPGLQQLKEILLCVIDEFERDRQYVCRKLAAYYKEQEKNQAELDRLNMLAEARVKWEEEQKRAFEKRLPGSLNGYGNIGAPVMNPVEAKQIVDKVMEEKEQEVSDLKDEIRMLRTLSTTGIMTNTFMHELRALTNNIGMELNAAYEALKYDNDPAYAEEKIVQAVRFKQHFASWFGVTIDAVKKDKRKQRTIQLEEYLAVFFSAWRSILTKYGAELEVFCEPGVTLRCFSFDLENIFSNLISNSISSFERPSEVPLDEKKISIRIYKLPDDRICIDYNDTGWGLPDKYKLHPERTLEAFETDKIAVDGDLENDGTGMGMWITDQIAHDYKGYVDLEGNKTLERGYCVTIILGGTDGSND